MLRKGTFDEIKEEEENEESSAHKEKSESVSSSELSNKSPPPRLIDDSSPERTDCIKIPKAFGQNPNSHKRSNQLGGKTVKNSSRESLRGKRKIYCSEDKVESMPNSEEHRKKSLFQPKAIPFAFSRPTIGARKLSGNPLNPRKSLEKKLDFKSSKNLDFTSSRKRVLKTAPLTPKERSINFHFFQRQNTPGKPRKTENPYSDREEENEEEEINSGDSRNYKNEKNYLRMAVNEMNRRSKKHFEINNQNANDNNRANEKDSQATREPMDSKRARSEREREISHENSRIQNFIETLMAGGISLPSSIDEPHNLPQSTKNIREKQIPVFFRSEKSAERLKRLVPSSDGFSPSPKNLLPFEFKGTNKFTPNN